jgi:hypothetical protein
LGFAVKPASARHGGHFWGGFAAGTATGLVVGTITAPRYYAPGPSPVYVYPPAPVCRDFYTDGYWRQVPVMDFGGFTTYRSEWIPGSYQRICQ